MRLAKTNGARKLLDAVAEMAMRGIRVKPGTWRDGNEVCLCGAVLLATDAGGVLEGGGEGIIRAVAKKLGITVKQAASLNNGFEGARINLGHATAAYDITLEKVDRKWYTIGKAFRRRWEKLRDT